MKSLLKVALFTVLTLGIVYIAAPQSADAKAPQMTVEKNTDRPGSDYRNFAMEKPQPNVCRKACKADTRCKAYTYVKPGHQGPKARCWLKYRVPRKRACSWCESGVKK